MSTFRIAPHGLRVGAAAVEVFRSDGEFVAAIYATDDEIKIVSKRLTSVQYDPTHPPTVIAKLDR